MFRLIVKYSMVYVLLESVYNGRGHVSLKNYYMFGGYSNANLLQLLSKIKFTDTIKYVFTANLHLRTYTIIKIYMLGISIIILLETETTFMVLIIS